MDFHPNLKIAAIENDPDFLISQGDDSCHKDRVVHAYLFLNHDLSIKNHSLLVQSPSEKMGNNDVFLERNFYIDDHRLCITSPVLQKIVLIQAHKRQHKQKSPQSVVKC